MMNADGTSIESIPTGILPPEEIEKHLQMAHDPVSRRLMKMSILNNKEYRELRQDKYRFDKEAHEKTMRAQDAEDWNFGWSSNTISSGAAASTFDEDVEIYEETFPGIADTLFKMLEAKLEGNLKTKSIFDMDMDYLNSQFDSMAHMFQTDNIKLDQRISELSAKYTKCKIILKTLQESLRDVANYETDLTFADPIEIKRSLELVAEDLEHYTLALIRTSRVLARLQEQKKIYKMINIMIFKVRVERLCKEKEKANLEQLKTELNEMTKLLQDRNIPFHPTAYRVVPFTSLLDQRRLSFRQEVATRILHFQRQSSSYFADFYDLIRRELFWPWNVDVTSQGIFQALSFAVLIIGILVCISILRKPLPVQSI